MTIRDAVGAFSQTDFMVRVFNSRYSVFALRLRAYPNFCVFAHSLDTILHAVSAERLLKMGEGDELCGRKESFKIWAQDVFKAACGAFCVGDEMTIHDAVGAFSQTDLTWSPGKFRLTPSEEISPDICEGLSKLHGKTVVSCRLIKSKQLRSLESMQYKDVETIPKVSNLHIADSFVKIFGHYNITYPKFLEDLNDPSNKSQ
ncbi:hypothetical protein CHS0354_042125 [Potamilus streckersoni]|uniref:nitric-oxide synthase (NADPH) n=1 Tax=Potamilus streckersoni TaxID=2493646 RepID=A0AAE0WFT6_9BIVA|nr:hypothetical protein CHS0354_042125 [Potamilus streckersoni]